MVFYFASSDARQQASTSAISLFPYVTEKSHRVFLYFLRQISRPIGESELTRGGCYAASAKLLLFLAFIFNVPFLTQTWQTAARLS